ncbi:MAG: magnesium protoporphyrin IX methyltransferase [Proteobacteria bacterium]|nr:magnesium protoporphyrin IX methyltransferase [Pseudomonadota bacterium]
MAASYLDRREQIEHYFDRTAADAWRRLTSDAPVGRIRATVRAGRDTMRATLLGWLPADLTGRRILDAGCGTGAFATEAARRGATVVAVDLSPTLVGLARERAPRLPGPGSIEFRVGDMLEQRDGRFDHVVAMDSLIHYGTADVVAALVALSRRATRSVLATFAPSTPLLATMHAVGRCFPRSERAPAIVPVGERQLLRRLAGEPDLIGWQAQRTERVSRGFYTSQALEIVSTDPA